MQTVIGQRPVDVSEEFQAIVAKAARGTLLAAAAAGTEEVLKASANLLQRERLLHLMESENGNVSAVARLLGVTRRTVYKRLRQLGIDLGREGQHQAPRSDRAAQPLVVATDVMGGLGDWYRRNAEANAPRAAAARAARFYVGQAPTVAEVVALGPALGVDADLATVEDFERAQVLHQIEEDEWSCARAARSLGISRPTIYKWMKRLGIDQAVITKGRESRQALWRECPGRMRRIGHRRAQVASEGMRRARGGYQQEALRAAREVQDYVFDERLVGLAAANELPAERVTPLRPLQARMCPDHEVLLVKDHSGREICSRGGGHVVSAPAIMDLRPHRLVPRQPEEDPPQARQRVSTCMLLLEPIGAVLG